MNMLRSDFFKLFLPLCAVFAVLFTMLIACANPEVPSEGNSNTESTSLGGPTSSVVCAAETAAQLQPLLPVKIFFADKINEKLIGEMHYIDIASIADEAGAIAEIDASNEAISPLTAKIAEQMISLLINGPEDSAALNPVIPAGTALTSAIEINEDGIATVSFNDLFIKNHPGTLSSEAMTLYAVTNTLTGLAEIKGVKFLIGGETVAVYGNNFAMDREFPCVASLVSKSSLR